MHKDNYNILLQPIDWVTTIGHRLAKRLVQSPTWAVDRPPHLWKNSYHFVQMVKTLNWIASFDVEILSPTNAQCLSSQSIQHPRRREKQLQITNFFIDDSSSKVVIYRFSVFDAFARLNVKLSTGWRKWNQNQRSLVHVYFFKRNLPNPLQPCCKSNVRRRSCHDIQKEAEEAET